MNRWCHSPSIEASNDEVVLRAAVGMVADVEEPPCEELHAASRIAATHRETVDVPFILRGSPDGSTRIRTEPPLRLRLLA